jgi:hypothetical protein
MLGKQNYKTSILFSFAVGISILTAPISYAVETAPSPTEETDEKPYVRTWADSLPPDFMDRFDDLGKRLSDAIFNGIDDANIFNITTDRGNTFGVKVSRRVFDNNDAPNSWTVVDYFNVNASIPIWSHNIVNLSSKLPIGFSLGGSMGLQLINIRTVLPADYDKFPKLKDLRERAKENATDNTAYQNFMKGNSTAPGKWLPFVTDDGNTILPFLPVFMSPENNARYSRLWNHISLPITLPLKALNTDYMAGGEIISYVGTGTISAGPSFGWVFDPIGATNAINLGVSWNAFLTGSFRISVLKETDKVVRVKVTRSTAYGHSKSIGAEFAPNPLEGFFIVRAINRQLKVIPFSLSDTRQTIDSLDLGYRYDLTKIQAQGAYEKAVVGDLSASHELAFDESGKPRPFAETGVEKIFERESVNKNKNISSRVKVSFLFRSEDSQNLSQISAKITLPDGVHHVFTSVSSVDSNWRTVWASYEKYNTNFSIYLDLDELKINPESPKVWNFIADGKMEDSGSGFSELKSYIQTVEDAIGKYGIFPRPPTMLTDNSMPITAEKNENPKNRQFGWSSFFYRIFLTRQQIDNFVQFKDSEMWAALEKAFDVDPGSWKDSGARRWYYFSRAPFTVLNVPLNLMNMNISAGSKLSHAEDVYDEWVKLKVLEDGRPRAEAMGRLFYDRYYGYQLTRLLRSSLEGQTVSYFAEGNNRTFGRIVDSGTTTLLNENIASKADRDIGFDREGSRPSNFGTDAIVKEFRVTMKDHRHMELKFRLDKMPYGAFIQILLNNPWWPFKNGKLVDFFLPNVSMLKVGENVFDIDLKDQTSPWYGFTKFIDPGNRYIIRMAVNNDRVYWGPAVNDDFRVPAPPAPVTSH